MESFKRFISNRALILYIQLRIRISDLAHYSTGRFPRKSYTRSLLRASFEMPSFDVPVVTCPTMQCKHFGFFYGRTRILVMKDAEKILKDAICWFFFSNFTFCFDAFHSKIVDNNSV